MGDAVVDILEGQNVRFHLFLDTKVSLAPTRMSVRKLVGWSVVLSNCGVKIVPAAYIASHCWSQKGKTTLYFLKVYFLKVYFLKVYCPKLYFPKVYFPKVYDLKVYFAKVYFVKACFPNSFFQHVFSKCILAKCSN